MSIQKIESRVHNPKLNYAESDIGLPTGKENKVSNGEIASKDGVIVVDETKSLLTHLDAQNISAAFKPPLNVNLDDLNNIDLPTLKELKNKITQVAEQLNKGVSGDTDESSVSDFNKNIEQLNNTLSNIDELNSNDRALAGSIVAILLYILDHALPRQNEVLSEVTETNNKLMLQNIQLSNQMAGINLDNAMTVFQKSLNAANLELASAFAGAFGGVISGAQSIYSLNKIDPVNINELERNEDKIAIFKNKLNETQDALKQSQHTEFKNFIDNEELDSFDKSNNKLKRSLEGNLDKLTEANKNAETLTTKEANKIIDERNKLNREILKDDKFFDEKGNLRAEKQTSLLDKVKKNKEEVKCKLPTLDNLDKKFQSPEDSLNIFSNDGEMLLLHKNFKTNGIVYVVKTDSSNESSSSSNLIAKVTKTFNIDKDRNVVQEKYDALLKDEVYIAQNGKNVAKFIKANSTNSSNSVPQNTFSEVKTSLKATAQKAYKTFEAAQGENEVLDNFVNKLKSPDILTKEIKRIRDKNENSMQRIRALAQLIDSLKDGVAGIFKTNASRTRADADYLKDAIRIIVENVNTIIQGVQTNTGEINSNLRSMLESVSKILDGTMRALETATSSR